MKTAAKHFEQEFEKQLLLSERFRALLLALVFAFLISVGYFNYYIFHDFFDTVFIDKTAFLWAMGVGLFVIARSVAIYFLLDYRIKKSKGALRILRNTNSLFEISIPTIVIILFAEAAGSRMVLITPAVFLYFLFIFFSVLELDFKISFITGLTGALQYSVVSYYYISKLPPLTEVPLLNNLAFYIVIAIILLFCGLISGFISLRIKRSIVESFNHLEERNRIQKLFGQQVSIKIVDELLDSDEALQSTERKVCIMFLDIRGFTPYCESKLPEEIIEYQNQIFGFMIEIVNNNHGIINQFMGDGFMATFGVPSENPDDCKNAIQTALEIVDQLELMNTSGKIPGTRIGIGLHYGDVVTGNVGTDIRMQYSITGNTVILAARLEQLTKLHNSPILISEEVFEKIDHFSDAFESIGEVEIKGRKKPIHIFKIKDKL